MNRDSDVDLIGKAEGYKGWFRINIYSFRHKLFGGGWSKPFKREVFERGHAVAVLPYDPVRDEVVLIEQFRAGAYAAGGEPWLIEAVAGVIEKGETPEDVARREAVEEANCTITDLDPAGAHYVSPGGTSELCHIFIGRCSAEGLGGIHGLADENEDIRVFTLPFAEVRAMHRRGEITVGPLVVALLWLELERERLRREWR